MDGQTDGSSYDAQNVVSGTFYQVLYANISTVCLKQPISHDFNSCVTDGPTDGPTDRRTDQRTDKAGCRVA